MAVKATHLSASVHKLFSLSIDQSKKNGERALALFDPPASIATDGFVSNMNVTLISLLYFLPI